MSGSGPTHRRTGHSTAGRRRRAEPISRRDRPAKPPLTRAGIVAETIAIMERDGLAAATMRRVARALDTGAASLYVYVANTAELHAAVLDTLLERVQISTNGDWFDRLRRLLGDYRNLLMRYPGLARSALTIRPSGPYTLRLVENIFGLLIEGGMDNDRAAWAVDLLMLYTTALSAEHGALPSSVDAADRDERWTEMVDALRSVDPAVAPTIAGNVDVLLGGTPEQRWAWALTVLVRGSGATPTPTAET